MNSEKISPQKESIQDINIKLLIPTPDNTREINEKSPAFTDLLASVRKSGVKIPVIARPHPTQKGKFDMRAGARRLRAAKIAGLKTIPVIIREMSDLEAFDITYIENFGREDLTPLQEAALVAAMLEKHNGDYQAIADTLGKPVSWVALRANVGKNLAPEWVKAINAKDSIFAKWTNGHFGLIARFGHDTQVRLLKEAMENKWRQERISIKELQKEIDDEMRILKKAAWQMDEQLWEDGRKLPVCEDCTSRSGCRPMLFADKIEKDKGDMCLDSMCWQQKQIAATKRIIEKNKVKYPNLVIISDAVVEPLGVIKNKYEYMPAKKEDKKAVPCLDISNSKAGSVNWMKPRYADSAGTKTKGRKPATMESRKDEMNRKRWFFVLGAMEKLLDETPLEKITPKDKVAAVLILTAQFTASNEGRRPDSSPSWDKKLLNKKFQGSREWKITLIEVWEMVKPGIRQSFHYMGPITQTPDEKIEAGKKVAWLIGADIDELTKKACEEYPVPKAWKKLEATKSNKK